jgi:hypothetical protein
MGIIDDLIEHLEGPSPESGLKVLQTRISSSSILWTLYGIEAERFIVNVVSERAINQKFTADRIAEQVIGHLFQPQTCPQFNIHLSLEKELVLSQIEQDYGESVKLSILNEILHQKESKYLHIEVDGALYLHLNFPKPQKTSKKITKPSKTTKKSFHSLPDYTLIEIKLFTAPLENPQKSILRYLQANNLEEYFTTRHLFGLIGFSYLQRTGSPDPIARNDPVLIAQGDHNLPPFWAIHFFLCDQNILSEFANAPSRATAIFHNIEAHQRQIPHGLDPKGFKYGLTYNLVKVVFMNALLIELENENKDLRKKEAEARKKEAEARKKEAEAKKMAEKYRQKLLDKGISPDDD